MCFQCNTVVTLTSNFEATFDIYPNELVCELCKAMTWNRLELELVSWPLAFGVNHSSLYTASTSRSRAERSNETGCCSCRGGCSCNDDSYVAVEHGVNEC